MRDLRAIKSLRTKADAVVGAHGNSLKTMAWAWFRSATSSDIARKAAETLATRMLLIGISLLMTVLVARSLGPEGRGLYAVAITIGAIGVQFGNLGLHASNTYAVAANRALLPTLVGNALLVSIIIGGGGAIVAGGVFAWSPNLAPAHGLLLLLALGWIPFGLAYMLLQNLLLGIQEVRAYNKIELLTKILTVILVVVLIATKAVSVETIFGASLVALIASFIWALWRLVYLLDRFPWPSASLFMDNIRYGLKAYATAFFTFLVLRVDLLLVKQFLGAEQAGYYSIAASMADMVLMLPVVVGMILFPKLSTLPSVQEKWKVGRKTILLVAILLFFIAIIASLLVRPAVNILYGPSFLESAPAFIWLMPGVFFLGVQNVAAQFLNSIGYPKVIVVIWLIAFLLNLTLNLWLIPMYGIVGAAIASSFSYSMVFALIVLAIWRRVHNQVFR